MDGIPCDIDEESPVESEPKLAEEGNGMKVSEGMAMEEGEAIGEQRNEEEEDGNIQ